MQDSTQQKVILKFCINSIEIVLPNSYSELFTIFVENFNIKKKNEEFLKLTYNDEENDSICIYSEEDFETFKNLSKTQKIKNEIIGILTLDSRPSFGTYFNLENSNELDFNNSYCENKKEEEIKKKLEEDIQKYKEEIKLLKEENEKLKSKLKENDMKFNEQKKTYETQLAQIKLENSKLKIVNYLKKL